MPSVDNNELTPTLPVQGPDQHSLDASQSSKQRRNRNQRQQKPSTQQREDRDLIRNIAREMHEGKSPMTVKAQVENARVATIESNDKAALPSQYLMAAERNSTTHDEV